MTPSQYIKAQGLPNLAYVADKVGKHPDTINNWYHANFALFEAVVAGVKVKTLPNAVRDDLNEAKPVAWCDEEGNIISEYESAGSAARHTGVYKAGIVRCCKGGLHKYAEGARWQYIAYFNKSGNTINLKMTPRIWEAKKEQAKEHEEYVYPNY